MSTYIFSYKRNSKGAKALARELGIKRLKHNKSRFIGNKKKTIINWGATTLPIEIAKCNILNSPDAIIEAANKLSFFNKLKDKKLTPPFTTDREIAEKWIQKGYKVVCRTMLNASGGRGIVIDKIVDAPLYVRYIPKQDEYRVHIMRGKIFDIQRKARRIEDENPNWQIRNHNNGFVFIRDIPNLVGCVSAIATAVFDIFTLDFGAIDIIYNAKKDRAYALEINTAPGLEGQTVENYANAFKEIVK